MNQCKDCIFFESLEQSKENLGICKYFPSNFDNNYPVMLNNGTCDRCLTESDLLTIYKESEEKINSPEYIEEHRKIQEQCDQIKLLPLNSKEEIRQAKEQSRSIPYSPEKVLLFKYLIFRENNL